MSGRTRRRTHRSGMAPVAPTCAHSTYLRAASFFRCRSDCSVCRSGSRGAAALFMVTTGSTGAVLPSAAGAGAEGDARSSGCRAAVAVVAAACSDRSVSGAGAAVSVSTGARFSLGEGIGAGAGAVAVAASGAALVSSSAPEYMPVTFVSLTVRMGAVRIGGQKIRDKETSEDPPSIDRAFVPLGPASQDLQSSRFHLERPFLCSSHLLNFRSSRVRRVHIKRNEPVFGGT